MRQLLAKSPKAGQVDKTLLEHSRDLLIAVEALFGHPGEPTRLGLAWLRFFGLAAEEFDRFLRHLRVAVVFHDLGKANDGFQDEIRHNGTQVVRHEFLSGLIMVDHLIDTWLRGLNIDVIVVLSSVVSHHVKAGYESLGKPLPGVRSGIHILTDHPDFPGFWDFIQQEVGTACPFPVQYPKRLNSDEIKRQADVAKSILQKEKSRLRADVPRRRLLSAVRAALIVADSVGSAVIRLNQPIAEWVRTVFKPLLRGHEIQEEIIEPRIARLRSRGRWDESKGLSGFQRGIVAQGPRVLLTTPCGSGKTLAAWNWVRTQVDQSPAARVLFLYPTRATATEGFRDYVSWAPETDATLVSGTAEFELQDMFRTQDDERWGRDYRADPRLFALGLWGKRYFSATADQFFPFLQYAYAPLCLLPVLAEAIIVVDEVHSFDRSMYASLKRFLKEFPVPVLCMTATLPTNRRDDLIGECGLKAFPDEPLADIEKMARAPRYLIQWVNREQADALVDDALSDRWRVLWVANRVADCQQTWGRHRERSPDAPVFCYHSRYRLIDRRDRHDEVVRAFQDAVGDLNSPRAVLAVTTQVCEMSLDLDADMLVTELSSIASLIQRMGRCNRKWPITPGRIGWVYVLQPESNKEKPYDSTELEAAARFIDDLAGRPISQGDLEALYEKHDTQIVEPERHCPFLDSGPFAEAGEESFREIEEFTLPCVLDEDLPDVLTALQRRPRQSIDGYIVPVPRRHADPDARPGESEFPRWLSIALARHYHVLSGFHDTPLDTVSEGPSS